MSKTAQWLLLVVLGGLAGLFVGELLCGILPSGLLKDILSKTVAFGLAPPGTLDIKFFAVTFGFQIKMSLTGLLGLGLSFYLGKFL